MESKEPYTTTTAPLSPPPVYEKPGFGTRLQELMNTFWVYEIIASLVSLAMLAAIFGVLHHYNGWDVDLWDHSWSLGSLIGLLATISQVAMAVPLASGISQLKWTWYRACFYVPSSDPLILLVGRMFSLSAPRRS
jgi:hypothetical protein